MTVPPLLSLNSTGKRRGFSSQAAEPLRALHNQENINCQSTGSEIVTKERNIETSISKKIVVEDLEKSIDQKLCVKDKGKDKQKKILVDDKRESRGVKIKRKMKRHLTGFVHGMKAHLKGRRNGPINID